MDNGLEVFLLRTLPRSKGRYTYRAVQRLAAKAKLEVLPWVYEKIKLEGSMSYGCKDPEDSHLVFLSTGSRVDRYDLRTQEKLTFNAESADSKLNIRIWGDLLLMCHYNGSVRVYKDYSRFPSLVKVWTSQTTFMSKLALGAHGDAIGSNDYIVGSDYYYLGQDEAVHKVDLQMIADLSKTTVGPIEPSAEFQIDTVVCTGPVGTFTFSKTKALLFVDNQHRKIFRKPQIGPVVEADLTEEAQQIATHIESVGPKHVLVGLFDPKANMNSVALYGTNNMSKIQKLDLHPDLQSYLNSSSQDESNHFRNVHVHQVSKELKLVLCVLRCIGLQTYFFANDRLVTGPYINKFDPNNTQQGYIFTIVHIKTERSLEAGQKKPKHKAEWWVLLGSGTTTRFGLYLS